MAQENISLYDVIEASDVEDIKKSLKIVVSHLGIHVDFDLNESKNFDGRLMVSVKSTEFQTMPVIYKSICIKGNGFVVRDTDKKDILHLSIYLWYHFDCYRGGTNGVDIGVCEFVIFADTKRVMCNGLTLKD